MLPLVIKSILSFIVIAGAETLHGVFRIHFMNPKLGDRSARRIGVITGSIIVFIIAWTFFSWIDPANEKECFIVGGLWFILMVAVDIGFGRFVFHFSWERIIFDFDLTKGNFLALGMLFLLFTPLLVFELRALF